MGNRRVYGGGGRVVKEVKEVKEMKESEGREKRSDWLRECWGKFH